MLVFVLLCIITLCPFYFGNHLDEEKRAGCFVLMFVNVSGLWLLLSMPWVGLHFVIVIFL